MNPKTLKKVVIAGGGTAGWMAAASLSKALGKNLDITLVESEEIGTVGVGEATIPTMLAFHKLLGLDEAAFMRAVQGTFKLGISFENWGNIGESYIHSFGNTGQTSWAADFQHFWLRGLSQGIDTPFGDYCLELQAAKAGKFALTENPRINYAYHMDASRYARLLRSFSEELGVKRLEGKIVDVATNASTGFIESLQLESGLLIDGDLFIDCSGFRGLLIEQTLKTGYEDWTHWLPCDTAVAVQTESIAPPLPLTRSIAHESGWQWRIALQHRVGNGLVFCSKYMSEDEAKAKLLNSVDGKPIMEPRVIRYKTGRRLKAWNKNCIAMGLASGFIEPLESTSIHLIMSSVLRLIKLFPHTGISQMHVDEYNQQSKIEVERVRDFIVLHYKVTDRNDSAFWNYCRTMEIPETLAQRINLFRETGLVFKAEDELFRVDSWTQVMLGQGIMPKQYHPAANMLSNDELGRFLSGLNNHIKNTVPQLPSHDEFIKRYCRAEVPV